MLIIRIEVSLGAFIVGAIGEFLRHIFGQLPKFSKHEGKALRLKNSMKIVREFFPETREEDWTSDNLTELEEKRGEQKSELSRRQFKRG